MCRDAPSDGDPREAPLPGNAPGEEAQNAPYVAREARRQETSPEGTAPPAGTAERDARRGEGDPRSDEGLEEFEDEAPGSYLAELGAGRANLIWAAGNLALTGALLALRLSMGAGDPAGEEPFWWAPAKLVWLLLPASGVVLAVLTLWQLAHRFRPEADRSATWSLALTAAALLLWLAFELAGPGFGVVGESS